MSSLKKFCVVAKFGFQGYFMDIQSFNYKYTSDTDNTNDAVDSRMLHPLKLMEECDYGIYYEGLTGENVFIHNEDDDSETKSYE